MGIYLNSEAAYRLYKNEAEKPYFVDKTLLLEELFPLVKEGTNYVCITRPRRFGKTVMANMITAFFSKARDSADIFDTLKISRNEHCQSFRNQYGVIHISFDDISRQCTNYEQYIDRIERRLIRDLKKEYPEVELTQEDSAVDALLEIYEEDSSARFIFVLDEWDFLFHQPFVTEEENLALMVSGVPVPAKVREYAAASMSLRTKDEILSAMVVYGFLSYENGNVAIPNKELMDRFDEMLQKEASFGYVYRLARESGRMLEATLRGDTDTMAEILELVHNTETPLMQYNHETELTAVINLVYLSARDRYRVEREDKAGIGYVDFIFYPEMDRSADCIILELKVDHNPEEAIRQIKEKKYDLRFRAKLGENPRYTGRILAVGIGYEKKRKKHRCKLEVLREAYES